MKTWKQKADIPGVGVCVVKEYSDDEATNARRRRPNYYVTPASMGFVNLFRANKFVAVCGVDYAKARLV